MTSSPGSTSARIATARAANPPFVMATSAGSHFRPVCAESVRATVICDFGSLSL